MITIQDIRVRHERMSIMGALWINFILGNLYSYPFVGTLSFNFLIIPTFTLTCFNLFYLQEIYSRYNLKKYFLLGATIFFTIGFLHSKYYITKYPEIIATPIILYSILPQLVLLYRNYLSSEPLYLYLLRPEPTDTMMQEKYNKSKWGVVKAYLCLALLNGFIWLWSWHHRGFYYFLWHTDIFQVITFMQICTYFMVFMNFRADLFDLCFFLFMPISHWLRM